MELLAAVLVPSGVALALIAILRRIPAVILALSSSLHEVANAAQPEVTALKDRVLELQGAVAAQQLKLEGYQSLWRQEAERAETAYARARAALSSARRAQREAEESGERDVPSDDADRSEGEAVQPVRARVAAEPPPEHPLAAARRSILMRQVGRR